MLMSIVEHNCSPIVAIQTTPQNILLLVTRENFWNCVQAFNKNNVKLRFLEKREPGLDVHLSFFIQQNLLEITFRIVDPSPIFDQDLTEFFPSAAVFLNLL